MLFAVDGTCFGLDEGSRVIKLVIGPCDGYGLTDGHAGWNSPRSMIIMEVVPQNTAGMSYISLLFD